MIEAVAKHKRRFSVDPGLWPVQEVRLIPGVDWESVARVERVETGSGRVVDLKIVVDESALKKRFPLAHQRRKFLLKLNEAVRRCSAELSEVFSGTRRDE